MRRTVEVRTDPSYSVHVGPGLLSEIGAEIAGATVCAVIADERVLELHGAALAGLEHAPRITFAGEEASKSFGALERALDFVADAGLGRDDLVVTLGGGVLTDLGGLTASLYKRGVGVVHAPTTLLAQVDASVGGKTAINLAAGKNLAGTFHQPHAVIADTRTLATLPGVELASGLGEVLKTALIGGEADLAALEARAEALAARDEAALTETVATCVAIKARIVAEDPGEKGSRRALNLGHTFAHGIEHAAGYGVVPHGIAVACGIGLALRAAGELGLDLEAQLAGRVCALCDALDLPANLGTVRERFGVELGPEAILAGMAHDKKGAFGAPELVLLRAPGELQLGVKVEAAALSKILGS